MANRWCDGFGRYGGDEAKMLNGSSSQAWAEVDSNFTLSSANPRTGTHCLRLSSGSAFNQQARRVFGAPLTEVLIGGAVHFSQLPTQEYNLGLDGGIALAILRDQSNGNQVGIWVGTDGAIYAVLRSARGGSDNVLLGRSIPVIGAGAYQHFEIYANASATDGALEVRIDEITRLSLTGVATAFTSNIEFSQWVIAKTESYTLPVGMTVDFADLYCNDTINDGSGCHTFIGDCKSGWLPVNADTAQADFAPSAGSDGFALLDDTPPDDGTFISTSSTTAESDFGLTDGPANLSEILTVRPAVRAQKDDAGSALIAPSMKSNNVKAAIDGQPITTAFAYYDANVPFNPDTDAPWTLSELDAALHVVERVE